LPLAWLSQYSAAGIEMKGLISQEHRVVGTRWPGISAQFSRIGSKALQSSKRKLRRRGSGRNEAVKAIEYPAHITVSQA
jgi:hypothetical protein